jgi:riboflavin kinase/FMN adenylyltransferase
MSGDIPAAFTLSTFPHVDGSLTGGVVAIGNFDGMHRGHQAVLEAARTDAEAIGVPSVVLTFEPHPRDVFRPEEPVFRLTPPHVKARVAAALGLGGLVTVPFTRDFAKVPAETFVREVLVGVLGARRVAIGWNFHFGAGRGGNPDSLEAMGRDLGFTVDVVEPFADEGGAVVSSSRIRSLLGDGEVAEAAALLGYRWFFEGVVVDGDKRGRTIGYPTANVRLPPQATLRHGIYAVLIEIDGETRQGVASWGRRPTFDDGAPVFETHVFDFAGDLYGKMVAVTPVSYLRPELRFDGVDALVAQMDRDSAEARAFLAAMTPMSPLDRAVHWG